jgi:hypothetical protein
MKKLTLLAMLVVFGATASPAFGQATRTWVSGVGDDANPCSRTAPCKTLGVTLSKTAADGIINLVDDCLCGPVSIGKSITIDGGHHTASIIANGVNGVSINVPIAVPDPRRRVTLRNLYIDGHGAVPGLNGVIVRGAGAKTLVMENLQITGFSRAGVFLDSDPASGFPLALPTPLSLSLDNSVVEGNGNGLNLRTPSSSQQVNALVKDNRFSQNHANGLPDTGIAVAADGGAHLWMTGNSIFANDVGLRTFAANGGSGVIDTFCDDEIFLNTDNGTAPNQLCPQPPPPANVQTLTRDRTYTRCVVPSLRGLRLTFAKRLLSAAGCRLGTVSRRTTGKRRRVGRVIAQRTRAGTELAQGSKVNVTVGKRGRRS